MDNLSKFSERLSELMQESEILSEQLSKEIGISGSIIRRWCKNDPNLLLGNMLKVADFFQCSLDFLAGRTETQLDFVPKPCPPFNKRFRYVLEKCDVSTYELRNHTKIKGLHIHKWDNGSDPKLSSLLEIANYLNVTLDYLVGRDDD